VYPVDYSTRRVTALAVNSSVGGGGEAGEFCRRRITKSEFRIPIHKLTL